MAVLQDGAKIQAFYNGNALNWVTSIHHTTNSGQQRIDLLNEGLAGFTPGSGDCELEIGYAVPIGGPEATYQEDCANGTYVTFQMSLGAVSYIGRGKIMNNKVGQSNNANTEGTCSWIGEMKSFS
jgi:hypothetical protein